MRLALLLLVSGCTTARDCAIACARTGQQMASFDGRACSCVVPTRCALETRAADAAINQTELALTLLDACSGALSACQTRGGGVLSTARR
jgi:hypothetical protein